MYPAKHTNKKDDHTEAEAEAMEAVAAVTAAAETGAVAAVTAAAETETEEALAEAAAVTDQDTKASNVEK
jgi:hypothetical protein